MQADTGNGNIAAMQQAFQEKYDEPLPAKTLTQLTIKYGDEAVTRVIENMKPDAYEAADYLERCLSSGWYQSSKPPSGKGGATKGSGAISSEAAKTLRFTWNYKMERGWISRDERDYMLDVILNGVTPDEERVQDISFRCLQGMYPNTPATWFYWLPQHQRRAAANAWIAKSGKEDLKPYEVT